MIIKSSSFKQGETIPITHTCDGRNINPSLAWSDVPDGVKSFVLIVEDPDVPRIARLDGLWIHWVVWNIPSSINNIPENSFPVGAVVGKNTSGDYSYDGPCPPDKEHRYFFKLYALDTMLTLDRKAGRQDLLDAIEEHVLASAEIMGVYNRKR